MFADDIMNQDSARNQAINQLAEICAAMGLSWSATEKAFVIDLPNIVIRKASQSVEFSELPTKPKTFDVSNWGNVDVFGNAVTSDTLPDDFQMPDYGEKLEEGEPPKGDTNAEA